MNYNLYLIGFGFLISGTFLLAKGFIFVHTIRESSTYIGMNPHLAKSKILQKYEAIFGIFMFMCGVALQLRYPCSLSTTPALSKIFWDIIMPAFLLSLASMYISKKLTKREFYPMVIDTCRDGFSLKRHIIEHNGLEPREVSDTRYNPSQEVRNNRIADARRILFDIASVFDVAVDENISNQELINRLSNILR